MTAKRDDNRVPVAMGEYNGIPTELLIDHVTGRLLMSIESVSDVVPSSSDITHDNNRVKISRGEYNGSSEPMLIDNRNNNLWINLVIE